MKRGECGKRPACSRGAGPKGAPPKPAVARILPWAAGWISTFARSIHAGMAVIPASILVMMLCQHTLRAAPE